jgi:glutaredoxin
MKFKFILYAPYWLAMLLMMFMAGLIPTGGIASENLPRSTAAQLQDAQSVDIEVFVREGCPHCGKAEEFLAKLMRLRPELKIVTHDVLKDPAALERLKYIAKSQTGIVARVPTFIVHGQLITGFSEEANSAQLTIPKQRIVVMPKPKSPAKQ